MTDQQSILNLQYQHALESMRPFMMLKPKMYPDGDMWCALYGENLMEGVSGFGRTPDEASYAFDAEWLSRRTPDSVRLGMTTPLRGS